MRKRRPVLLSTLALLALFPPGSLRGVEIPVRIAPNVLNINSQSQVVTIHTGIPYDEVDVTTVFLNGISIRSWKADARGEFVAKFSSDSVKTLDGLKIDEENTLILLGLTLEKEAFWGEVTILVIDCASGCPDRPLTPTGRLGRDAPPFPRPGATRYR